jgi:hypothetical protein
LAIVWFSGSVASVQIQSLNTAFSNAGIQGCIGAAENANGQPLIIHNCATESVSNQDWDLSFSTTQPQQIEVFGDKCIDVVNGINEDGTPLQIWTCAEGNTNQLWIALTDSTFQWSGTDKCIDLTNGLINDGNVIQVWTCSSGDSNQMWVGAPNPGSAQTVPVAATGGGPYCIAAASDSDGAEVALVECINSDFHTIYPNGNITWTVPVFPLVGQIQTFSDKCLDVPNGSTTDGVKLQIWTCTPGDTNQLFQVQVNSGLSQIEWNGMGKCIDLTGGSTTNENQIQLWDCVVPDDNPNQDWFRPGP